MQDALYKLYPNLIMSTLKQDFSSGHLNSERLTLLEKGSCHMCIIHSIGISPLFFLLTDNVPFYQHMLDLCFLIII